MYFSLVAGYTSAIVVIFAVAAYNGRLWPVGHEIGGGLRLRYTALALASVIAVGQLFAHGLLLATTGAWAWLTGALNQLLIFSPVFITVIFSSAKLDGHTRRIAFLPADRVMTRLATGTVAAVAALTGYHLIKGPSALLVTFPQLFVLENVSHVIQIFGEDVAIGLLLASLLRKVAPPTAVVAVGLLFAAGHVPAMLTRGETLNDFVRLVADGLLAAAVVAALLRVRDLWLIFPVHVAMDLMQFYD